MGNTPPADAMAREVCRGLGAEDDPALRSAIASLIEAARAAAPSFGPGVVALTKQLEACLAESPADGWSDRIPTLLAEDVWFCAALVDGDEKAVRAFERRLGPEISRALGRFALGDDQRAEVEQAVRVRLLVGDDDTPPRIGRFRGWGSLEGWVRTITARLALNLLRDRKGSQPLSRAPELLDASPEFGQLEASRRRLFMTALQRAFRGLPDRERALLRLRYLDGVQANALARSYDVHESTVSRWLASARSELQSRFETEARSLVREDTAVTDLLGAMQDRFGASLHQLFLSEIAESTEADS